MNEKEKMMTTKCEHKTSDTLASWARPKLSIDACTWGCGAILISVTDGNGISHVFTTDELLTLRERVAALEGELEYIRDLARTGLPPAGYSGENWAQHKLNRIAAKANTALTTAEGGRVHRNR